MRLQRHRNGQLWVLGSRPCRRRRDTAEAKETIDGLVFNVPSCETGESKEIAKTKDADEIAKARLLIEKPVSFRSRLNVNTQVPHLARREHTARSVLALRVFSESLARLRRLNLF